MSRSPGSRDGRIPGLGHLPRNLTATVHGHVSPRALFNPAQQGGSQGWRTQTPSESRYKAVQPCTKRLKSCLKKRACFFFRSCLAIGSESPSVGLRQGSQSLRPVRSSLVAQMVKHLPTMWETWVRSLGWEDLLEKEMATCSSTLAWKIPWTEEPGRLPSMGPQRVGHD